MVSPACQSERDGETQLLPKIDHNARNLVEFIQVHTTHPDELLGSALHADAEQILHEMSALLPYQTDRGVSPLSLFSRKPYIHFCVEIQPIHALFIF